MGSELVSKNGCEDNSKVSLVDLEQSNILSCGNFTGQESLVPASTAGDEYEDYNDEDEKAIDSDDDLGGSDEIKHKRQDYNDEKEDEFIDTLPDVDVEEVSPDDNLVYYSDSTSSANSTYEYLPYIPVKSMKLVSRNSPPEFTYCKRIKLPIPPTKLVIQVQHVGLNPVDLKILNRYLKYARGHVGVGREFSGTVLVVGDAMSFKFDPGDEVMGIFWHPSLFKGVCETSIIVDPRLDIIAKVPSSITMAEASGALFCLGASYNLLYKLEQHGHLDANSNILINGGTTSMSLFTIQLLKYYYRIPLNIVVVCSIRGVQQLHREFPDISDELVFIDYEAITYDGRLSDTIVDLVKNKNLLECDAETGTVSKTHFDQGKFSLVIDFIGGSDIIDQSDAIIAEDGIYITTVGDTQFNYEKDTFDKWPSITIQARRWLGRLLWDFQYEYFSFEPTVRSAMDNEWVDICVDLLYNEIVKVVVDKTYSWRRAHRALKHLKSGHAHGKIIIDVDKI